MAPRAVPTHYLRGNKREATPRYVAFFDTETREEKDGNRLLLSLRCWSMAFVDRHPDGASGFAWQWRSGETAHELADTLTELLPTRATTWIWAHNLGFDLTATGLPDLLAARGWVLGDFQLSDTSSFLSMKRGDQRLIMCDSFSWLPRGLQEIAESMRTRKVRLPKNDDSLAAWQKRCRVDVQLLGDAMLTILEWWELAKLGNWAVTGASCGWNAARHRGLGAKMLIDPDPEARAFERLGIYGGRREAWRVGRKVRSRFIDKDFVTAYLTVAAHYNLPVKRTRKFGPIPSDHAWMRSRVHTIIADVTVTTDIPCAPCRIDGSVCYPVGTFRTTLARPEIELVIENGGTVEIHGGYAYQTAPVLQPWAQWLMELLALPEGEFPPVIKIMLKHWSRAVIGRFAARTSRVVDEGPAIWPTWHIDEAMDAQTGARLDVITAGGKQLTMQRDVETDNAFPAVLTLVESYCRVALWRTVANRPEGMVWQMDTDGWLEQADYVRGGDAPANVPEPFRTAVKGVYGSVEVIGPNHLQLDAERRYAGLSKDAKPDDDGVFQAHIWPTLRWQLSHGVPGHYVRPLRRTKITGPYTMRFVCDDGSTRPVIADVLNGKTILMPPPGQWWGESDAETAWNRQHPTIRRLVSQGEQQTFIVESRPLQTA